MDILDLVTSALLDLDIPVLYGWYDDSIQKTHITFLEFEDYESNHADDEATTIEHYIQVDIWSLDVDEAKNLKKEIKKRLKSAGFLYDDGSDDFENDTKIWHLATRWLIIEEIQ